MDDKFSISLLVANQHGVLNRIAALFARRGFNIDSLTVGETENPRLSRMTIMATGDDYIKDQICKQLEKLEDVKLVELNDDNRVELRELLLAKVSVEGDESSELIKTANAFGADLVDLSNDFLVFQVTGEPAKLDRFIEHFLSKHNLCELGRTGPTAMGRGDYRLDIANRKRKKPVDVGEMQS